MAPSAATASAASTSVDVAVALLHTRLQRCVPSSSDSWQVLQAKQRAALCITQAYQDQLAKSVRCQQQQQQQVQQVRSSRTGDAPPRQQQEQGDVIHATDNTDDGLPDACDAPKAALPSAEPAAAPPSAQQQQQEVRLSCSPSDDAQDVVEDSQPCEQWPSQQQQQRQQQPSLRVPRNLLGEGSSAHELGSSSGGKPQQQLQQQPQPQAPQEEPQQPWPGRMQPLRHKQALNRLLGGSPHAAAPTAAGAASIPLAQQQQQPIMDAPVYLGRQRRLPRASLQQSAGAGPAAAQHPLPTWRQQQHARQLGLCEDSPGPQQQRHMLQMRGCHLFDAQSQAPQAGGDAHDTAAAAAAGVRGGCWPVRRPGAAAQQQLFSPHTATHEPPLAGGSSGGGGGSTSRGCRASTGTRLQQASGAAQHPQQPSAMSAGGPHTHHRQQHWLDQQSDEIEVTPSQQQPGRAGRRAAAVAAAAAAATAQRCPALHPWGSGVPTTAAATTAARAAAASFTAGAAAGAASAQQQQHGQLVGAAAGAVAATPATALLCRRADAADLATALFHTPGAPSAAAAAACVAGAPGRAPVADSRVAATPESVAALPPAASAGAQLHGSGAWATPMLAAAAASGLGGCSEIEETLPPSQEGFAVHAAQQPEGQGGGAQQFAAVGAVAATPPPAAAAAAFGDPLSQEWPSAAGGAALAPAAASQIPATPLSELQQHPQQDGGASVPGSAMVSQEVAGDADVGAAVGPIRCLLGSFVPESPIMQQGGSGSAAKGAEGAGCAAAGAAAARALADAAPGAADAAAASPADSSHAALVVPPPAAEVPPPARPWQQQQQTCQAGPAAVHGLMLPPAPPLSAAAAGAASAQLCTGRSVVHLSRRKLQRLQLGLPIVQLLCCQGGALVVCQDPHDSRRRLLQQLDVQGSGQQQRPGEQGIVAELVHAAAVSAPALSAAAAAAGTLDRGQELLQSGLLLLPPQPRPAQQLLGDCGSSSAASQLVAAVLPLDVQGLSSSSSWAAAAAPQAHRSGSSIKRKRLAEGASAACDSSSHGLSIYRLAKQQQHRGPDVSGINAAETAVQLVQRLSTPRAVCCMAASAEAGLLAAGGTGGWAYVWPLLPAAPEQQLVGAVDTTATAAAVDADAAAGAWRSKAAGGMRQPPPYQQQQAAAAVADAGGMIELPQAAYRGIALPEISELCFVLQPGKQVACQHAQRQQTASLLGPSSAGDGDLQQQQHGHRPDSSSSSCGARVMLVGCSSLGSVVVWDVAARSALFTVHSPEVRLSGLMALPPHAAAHAAAAVLEAVRSTRMSAARQPGQRDEAPPVLLLAQVCACSSSEAQQQQALRPVLLRNDNSCGLQLGVPLMSDAGSCGAVAAAALCGTTAVAAAAAGSAAQAWDVVTGEVRMRIWHKAAPAGAAAAAADATVAAGAVQMRRSAGSSDTLVLLGSTSGSLTLALL